MVNPPVRKPLVPRFSSDPCAKCNQFYNNKYTFDQHLGRSMRSDIVMNKIKDILKQTKTILQIPDDYYIGLVSGSDNGVMEMAFWNLLGSRKVTLLDCGGYMCKWKHDIVNELKLPDVDIRSVMNGEIPDDKLYNYPKDNDVVFAWNVTDIGYSVNNVDWISNDRTGLTICDASSIVFSQHLPWDKLDVTGFSFQNVLGGEAGIGVIVMSSNAMFRLLDYTPSWPIPNLYRLRNNDGGVRMSIFNNEPINTISTLSLLDYELILNWCDKKGVDGLNKKCLENQKVIKDFVQKHDWCNNLITNEKHYSPTVSCLIFNNMNDEKIKNMIQYFESLDVAYDISSFPTSPVGIRIWTGPTINASDIRILLEWIEWYVKK